DDRLLRAALVRAAALPGARPARVRPPGDAALVLRPRAEAHLPEHLIRLDPERGAEDPGERGYTRDRRRWVPALVVALVLQRARERLQHRLRAAEPGLPAREGAG